MAESDWQSCRAVNPHPSGVWHRLGEQPEPQTCIRRKDHDGSHRATAYEPRTVWWEQAAPVPHPAAADPSDRGA